MPRLMGYMRKESGQFFFTGLRASFRAKIAVIDGIAAVRLFFGPTFVPVRILPYNNGLAGFFIGTGKLVNRCGPPHYLHFYPAHLVDGFYKSGVAVKLIPLGEKIVK